MDVLIDELNVFVPDIVVLDEVSDDEAQYVGVPAVVFEVLTPSTRNRDRNYKARRLLGLGVKEIWLVDRDAKTIELVDLDGATLSAGATPARSRAIAEFELIPDELFGSA